MAKSVVSRLLFCSQLFPAHRIGLRLFLGSLAALFAISTAWAQPVELPSGVPVISSTIGEGETMIDAGSINQYDPIVLPALEHLVTRGNMPLPAVRQVPFSDTMDEWWSPSSEADAGNRFPFPSVRDQGDPDQALHIMQNIEAIWQGHPALEASVSYYRYRASFDPAPIHLQFTRAYATNEHPYTANQLYRELLEFDAPPAILPLQYLTIRFHDATPDKVWEHSGPAGTRFLESWLRQERIAGSLMVFDDMLVHSASPWAYSYLDVQAAVQLVPFSSATQLSVTETDDGCFEVNQDPKTPSFNTFSKRFARALGWVPTELTFVPRRVFIIKAVPNSPYPIESEVTIVVDRETMLPVMKIVRSDSGSLLRVVLGGFTIARSKAGAIVPIIRQVVSVTGGAREVDALSFDRYRRCGDARAVELRSKLDTKVLLALKKEPEGKKQAEEVGSQESGAQKDKNQKDKKKTGAKEAPKTVKGPKDGGESKSVKPSANAKPTPSQDSAAGQDESGID